MSTTTKIAVAGNPNSGKTSLFNALTGARHHVGNYPGVTVERVEGRRVEGDRTLNFVDLPGTYSLTAYSEEERVARGFLIEEKPDVVLNVVDASNVERNLYLTVQLIELGVPLVIAFNMSDVAEARGLKFNLKQLSHFLGAPIVPTVANKGKGIDELVQTVIEVARGDCDFAQPTLRYGREIGAQVDAIEALLEDRSDQVMAGRTRWTALKLLEGDAEVRGRVTDAELLEAVDRAADHIRQVIGDSPEIAIADRRYGYISGACTETVRSTVESRHIRSDRIDAVLTHRTLALPIFLGLMYLVFHATFTIGAPLMTGIEWIFAQLTNAIVAMWPTSLPMLLQSLIVDGVIGGVGGVLVFLPNIAILFATIAILEDTGYMARAAFIMDRFMHRIGLHGKSFIPMIIGFGCSVPAILATRTLENRRDRLTTMMVVPLMSCGGRLPIYTLLIAAFFPKKWEAPVLWGVYLTGIVLAIVAARILRSTVLRGENEPFVMELPPYRVPTLRGILLHTWYRSWHYIKKAGTVILAFSVLLWVLTTFPRVDTPVPVGADEATLQAQALEHSFAGQIGRGMEPLIRPMGFDWRIGTALIGAFAAKEIFVAQLGIVFAVADLGEHEASLAQRIQQAYSPLTGLCVILFILIAMPCLATVVATRRESGSWRWAIAQMVGLTAVAWLLVTVVYQVGSLIGLGVS